MAYDGDILDHCPAGGYGDFGHTHAVVVSGAAWNPCGHALLNVGGRGGWYYHVAEVRGYPRYMDEDGYQRYLKENGKREINRQRIPVPDPQKALLKLEELLSEKWTWGLLPHNCATFVEKVLQAGGADAGLYSNCPTRENFL